MHRPAILRVVGGLGAITLLLCSTTIVSHAFGRASYGLLLPAIEDDLGLSHSHAGLAGTAIYAAYVVGVFLVAMLAGRIEPIDLMKGGLVIATLGLIILFTATNLWQLALGLALAGGAGAPIWLTAPVLATATVAPEQRGLVIGMLSSFMGLSGVLIGFGTRGMRAIAADEGLWRPVWAAEAAWTLALLIAIVLFVRLDATARVEGGFSIALVRTIPSWLRVTVAYALFGGFAAGFSQFMVASLEEDGGLSRSTATLVYAAMSVCGIIGAPTMGMASDRVGRRPLLMGAMTGLIAASLIMAFVTGPLVVSGVLLYGAFAGSYPALIASYVRDHADARQFSQVFATITMLFTLLALALPVTVGRLADATGSFTAPYLMLSFMGMAALVLIAGLPDSRRSIAADAGNDLARGTSDVGRSRT